jgi:hypothetical protein
MASDFDARAGRIADWGAAAELPEPALRALASSPDPAERVWAAWALALLLGRASVPGARASLASEPTPGIRCQLVVVLAGLGENELLRTVALSDPDATVRGTACQYVVRTSPPGATTALAFALERLRVDVPRIGHAVLEEVVAGRLVLPDGVLAELLVHTSVETRRLVLEVLDAQDRLSRATKGGLQRLVPVEEDPDVLASAMRRLLREGAQTALVDCVAGAPEPRVKLVLSTLARAGLRFPWRDLEALSRRSEHGVAFSLLHFLPEPLERDAFRWLCARAGDPELDWAVLPLVYDALSEENADLVDGSVAAPLLRRFDPPDVIYDDEPPWQPSPTDLEKKRLLEARVRAVDKPR